MSKELVISANRHETRVAVVEDDLVAEIYHQRENEYSLAGSIHKGRVTRVLPGMQSAFVDIGLDRDAFLYVSDFFEDNEEYDKIVTSVEDKVLKLDRSPASVSAAPVVADPLSGPPAAPHGGGPIPSGPAELGESPALQDVPEAPTELVTAPAPPSAPLSPAGQSSDSAQRRDDRERHGRRGRRRRGQKGGGPRGLPDSKFYSPRPESGPARGVAPEAPPPELPSEPEVQATSPDDDFFVLPGESLAKYTEQDFEPVRSSQPGSPTESAAEIAAPPLPELAAAMSEVEEEESEPASPAEPAAAVALVPEEAPIPAEVAPPPSLAPNPSNPDMPTAESEAGAQFAEHTYTSPEEGAEPPEPLEAEAALADEAAVGDQAASGDEAAIADEEGPEPARIPTSLTAALREQGQGQRYVQHRNSRRMRRRGRDNRGGA